MCGLADNQCVPCPGEFVDLEGAEIPPEVVAMVPAPVAQVYRLVPVSFDEKSKTIALAMADFRNMSAIDDVQFLLGCWVKAMPATEEAVSQAIERLYPVDTVGMMRQIAEEFDNPPQRLPPAERAASALGGMLHLVRSRAAKLLFAGAGGETGEPVNDSPEIRFTYCMMDLALREGAGKLALEPEGEDYRVVLPAGGSPGEAMTISRSLGEACMERLKIMAGLAGPHAPPDPPGKGMIFIVMQGRHTICRVALSSHECGEGAGLHVEEQVPVFIGLSSHADPEENITRALIRLGEEAKLLGFSSFYGSPAVDRPDAPDCMNGVARVWTSLGPREFRLDVLGKIEAELGRVRTDGTCATRTIDLDLLLYGNEVTDGPELKLPHPGITDRPFLAQALLELEPGIVMPDTGAPLAEVVSLKARARLAPVPMFTEKVIERLRNEREALRRARP